MTWIVASSQFTSWPSRQIFDVRPEFRSVMRSSERVLWKINPRAEGAPETAERGTRRSAATAEIANRSATATADDADHADEHG
jgi:hypothetical protein